MNSTNIKTFLYVARCGSISGAADQLYITQPAVSARLQQLEQELGVPLVRRRKGIRSIELTAQGSAFVPLAEQWMALHAETESFSRQPFLTPLTVACPDSLNIHLFRPLYRQLALPKYALALRIRTHQSREIFHLIENREADIGFAFHLFRSDHVRCRPLFRERILLLCKGDFPKCPLTPEDLDPRQELYLQWSQDFQLWHDALWHSYGTPYIQLDTSALMADFLERGRFWCFCPASVATDFLNRIPGLQSHALTETPPDRICYILTPPESRSTATALFQEQLDTCLRSRSELILP